MFKYFYKTLFQGQYNKVLKIRESAVEQQLRSFRFWLKTMAQTAFGKDFNLHKLDLANAHFSPTQIEKNCLENTGIFADYLQFQQAVPIQDYEKIAPYIARIFQGEQNVLWPSRPLYFAKTSGTVSGAKFIPITRSSLAKQIATARYTLVAYALRSGDYNFLQNKMIFLTGSPELDKSRKIPVGRLSGIVNHHVPTFFRKRQKPSWQTNIIADWEEKLAQIVMETKDEKMGLISGIPPWILMYFEMLLAKTKAQDIGSLFPELSVIVHGGVNIAPYLPVLQQYLGREIAMLETFPASEGFIAFEDSGEEEGLLLNTDGGLFFEFLPVAEVGKAGARRYGLWEVQKDVQYALILNSNAGLASYLLGDTIRFVSLNPYKIVVTGRVGHFLSTFGEHIISEEVERAMEYAQQIVKEKVLEFTVTSLVAKEGQSGYEWYIEFAEAKSMPLAKIAELLDEKLQAQNSYYADLRRGNILKPARVFQVQAGAFREYMKSLGKLGGQNKLPRLKAERDIAIFLHNFIISSSI